MLHVLSFIRGKESSQYWKECQRLYDAHFGKRKPLFPFLSEAACQVSIQPCSFHAQALHNSKSYTLAQLSILLFASFNGLWIKPEVRNLDFNSSSDKYLAPTASQAWLMQFGGKVQTPVTCLFFCPQLKMGKQIFCFCWCIYLTIASG